MLTRLTLVAIDGYKTYLSPRKGYACAHRVHHGGESCSTFIRAQIEGLGLFRALPSIRARFSACKLAAVALSDARGSGDQTNEKKRKSDKCSDAASFADCCVWPSASRGKSGCLKDATGCDTPDCCGL